MSYTFLCLVFVLEYYSFTLKPAWKVAMVSRLIVNKMAAEHKGLLKPSADKSCIILQFIEGFEKNSQYYAALVYDTHFIKCRKC